MKQLIFILTVLNFVSCNSKRGSIGLPDKQKTDTLILAPDTSIEHITILENNKSILKALKESDSISKYGHETYRFFLLAPFNPLVLFRLTSADSTYLLTTKLFYTKGPDGSGADTLISEKETLLSTKDAIQVTHEIYNSMFWNLQSDTRLIILDATYWKIEGYRKTGDQSKADFNEISLYYRKSGPLHNIFQVLLKNSGVKLQYYE